MLRLLRLVSSDQRLHSWYSFGLIFVDNKQENEKNI